MNEPALKKKDRQFKKRTKNAEKEDGKMNEPALKKKDRQFFRNAYLVYTLFFALISAFLILFFVSTNKSLIHTGDAWLQHYKALVYYSDYLKTIVHNLFSGVRPVVPQWDFSLGLGSDIMTSLHYYAAGDPLNLIAVLIPKDKIHLLFQGLIIVRSYLAGIFFITYCRVVRDNDKIASVIGALTYCFGGYMLARSLKHPYFMNPMIYIPLIFIGVELVIRKRSLLVLAVSVAVSAMSNFYFFYMIVIITVFYVLLRLIFLYKTDIKKMLVPFLKIAAGSAVGVMIGSVILLPVITAFLGDGRRGISGYYFGLFYSYKYYLRMIPAFVSSVPIGESSAFSFSCITFLCVAVLFLTKGKNLQLKIAFVVGYVMHLFPALAYVMNGFAYVTNRWDFIFSFIVSYIVAVTVPLLRKVNKKQFLALAVSFVVYVLACIVIKLNGGIRLGSFAVSAVLIAVVLVLMSVCCGLVRIKKPEPMIKKTFVSAVLLITVAGICANIFYIFSDKKNDYIYDFADSSRLPALKYDINEAISQVSRNDTEFFRYDGSDDNSTNSAVLYGQNGLGYYWSLSNPAISQFRADLNLGEYLTYGYQGFDGRVVFNALANTKYYYRNPHSAFEIPAGYAKTSVKNVYENQNFLKFGYTYDSYVSDESLKDCQPIEIEPLMLSTAVTDTDLNDFQQYDGSLSTKMKEIPYEMKGSPSVEINQNGFAFYNKKGEISLAFKAERKSETYLCIRGLHYINPYDKTLKIDEKTVKSKDIKTNELFFLGYKGDKLVFRKRLLVPTEKYYWYSGRTDFDINLGCRADKFTSFKIFSAGAGTFTYDSMKIISRSMKGYSKSISALNDDTLENVSFSTNCVSGSISLEKSKLLCMSVPYSKGWKLYIDGKETVPLKVNYMYTGAVIPEGSHEVRMQYSTPGLKGGAVISAFGTLALAGWCIAEYVIGKRKRKN